MTIEKQDTENGTFYGYKFGSMPEVRYSSAKPPLVAGAPATNDPDSATVADSLPAPQDSPRNGASLPSPAEPPAAANFVYLRDLEPRPVV